jgi:glycopeptide antibiotics resistance protein
MLRHLLYPFLAYRSVLYPTLLLSLIVVPCWLIIRLYRLRASAVRSSFGREALLLAFVVYLCGIAAATLNPNDRARMRTPAMPGIELRPKLTTLACSSPKLRSGSSAQFFCMYNAKGNVLMFFPLGILIPLLWRRLRFWNVILIAIALSSSIEIVQYISQAWGSYRLADINDVILNTLGACAGLVVVSVLRRLLPRSSRGEPVLHRDFDASAPSGSDTVVGSSRIVAARSRSNER